MSLGGDPSYSLDNAVRTVASKGILVVVAAGNFARPASQYTPARTAGVSNGIYAIAALKIEDATAGRYAAPAPAVFSNFDDPACTNAGCHVYIGAPGTNVQRCAK